MHALQPPGVRRAVLLTERPRVDLERLLESQGIAATFQTTPAATLRRGRAPASPPLLEYNAPGGPSADYCFYAVHALADRMLLFEPVRIQMTIAFFQKN